MLVCATCGKPIEEQVLSAMDKFFHVQCFVCAKCKKPITEQLFQVKDNKPYCQEDYAELFTPRCHACNKPITDRIISALGNTWHEQHFVCSICKTKLAGQNFMERDGKPICQKCFENNIADKCNACTKPIIDKIILALDAKWHPECFKCVRCGKPITEEMFQVEDGFPICSVCSKT